MEPEKRRAGASIEEAAEIADGLVSAAARFTRAETVGSLAAARNDAPPPIEWPHTAPAGERVLDLAQGPDDVLYLAVGSDSAAVVVLLDRRERWAPVRGAA